MNATQHTPVQRYAKQVGTVLPASTDYSFVRGKLRHALADDCRLITIDDSFGGLDDMSGLYAVAHARNLDGTVYYLYHRPIAGLDSLRRFIATAAVELEPVTNSFRPLRIWDSFMLQQICSPDYNAWLDTLAAEVR